MGSFKGHVVPGSLFLLVGVWHTWSSVVRRVLSPRSFRVWVWSPVPGFDGRMKHLELYVITIGAFIDLCIELLFLTLPEGALCLIAGTVFSADYLIFFYHSTTHKGLECYNHRLLILLLGLYIASCVTFALPTSFTVDLCNSISITLQGLWFFQITFTLYSPMMPDGCCLKGDEITCNFTKSQVRGEYLANFQLFALVLGVFIVVGVSYGYATARFENLDMHLSEEGLD